MRLGSRHSVFSAAILVAMLASTSAVAWTPCGTDCDLQATPKQAKGHECCPDEAPAEPDPSPAVRLAAPDCCSSGCALDSEPVVLDEELGTTQQLTVQRSPAVLAVLPVPPVRTYVRPLARPAPPPRPAPTETTRLLI